MTRPCQLGSASGTACGLVLALALCAVSCATDSEQPPGVSDTNGGTDGESGGTAGAASGAAGDPATGGAHTGGALASGGAAGEPTTGGAHTGGVRASGGTAGEPGTGGAHTGGALASGGAAGEPGTGGVRASGGTAGGPATGGAGGSECGGGEQLFVPSCTPPTITRGCYEPCDDRTCTSGQCLELTVMPECALSCEDGCCAACAEGQAICIGEDHPPFCDDSRGFGTLTWGPNGGMVLFELSSTIEADGTFRLTRVSHGGAPDVSCEPALPDCGSASLDLDDVTRAVLHRDVGQALRTGTEPLLFGHDSRPVDGTVARIVVDGVVLEVGTPCDGQATCVPIPAGISRLVATLDALTSQQSSDSSCDSVRVE